MHMVSCGAKWRRVVCQVSFIAPNSTIVSPLEPTIMLLTAPLYHSISLEPTVMPLTAPLYHSISLEPTVMPLTAPLYHSISPGFDNNLESFEK